MGVGVIGLTAGRVAEVTVGSALVMGFGGGLLLATIQAVLADHHGGRTRGRAGRGQRGGQHRLRHADRRAVADRGAARGLADRPAGLARGPPARLVDATGGWPIDAPPPSRVAKGRLPGAFWIAAAMLFCLVAAEWCVTAWGATFVEDAAGVSPDTAVALMAGYFGGVLVGRTLGSRLARRYDSGAAARVRARRGRRGVRGPVAVDGAGAGAGRPVAARARARATCSRWGSSVTVALAPDRAGSASGRAVGMTSFAVLLAPLTVGALADATSLTRRARRRAGPAGARRGRARVRSTSAGSRRQCALTGPKCSGHGLSCPLHPIVDHSHLPIVDTVGALTRWVDQPYRSGEARLVTCDVLVVGAGRSG